MYLFQCPHSRRFLSYISEVLLFGGVWNLAVLNCAKRSAALIPQLSLQPPELLWSPHLWLRTAAQHDLPRKGMAGEKAKEHTAHEVKGWANGTHVFVLPGSEMSMQGWPESLEHGWCGGVAEHGELWCCGEWRVPLILPTHFLCLLRIKPSAHIPLGLTQENDPSVFSHNCPLEQAWAPVRHSSKSTAAQGSQKGKTELH